MRLLTRQKTMNVIAVGIILFFVWILLLPNSFIHEVGPATLIAGELRAIATALFECQEAITAANQKGEPLGIDSPFSYDEFRFGHFHELWPMLTTPIVFLDNRISKDKYNPDGESYLAASRGEEFLLISLGPDETLNTKANEIERAMEEGRLKTKSRHDWAYAPTNGSKSAGDILRY